MEELEEKLSRMEEDLKVRVKNSMLMALMEKWQIIDSEYRKYFSGLLTAVKNNEDAVQTCIMRTNEQVAEIREKLAEHREVMNAFDHQVCCWDNEKEDICDKIEEMRLAIHPTNG